ncbi:MAG: DUF5908 family protein [Chitinophagaceae bacterium]
MPVEIFELTVKANVKENADCGTTADRSGASGSAAGSGTAAAGNQAIIQECVTQVLEILRRNQER